MLSPAALQTSCKHKFEWTDKLRDAFITTNALDKHRLDRDRAVRPEQGDDHPTHSSAPVTLKSAPSSLAAATIGSKEARALDAFITTKALDKHRLDRDRAVRREQGDDIIFKSCSSATIGGGGLEPGAVVGFFVSGRGYPASAAGE